MILARACPIEAEGNRRRFSIETHCVTFEVTADVVPGTDPVAFTIISVTSKEN
jgi:hypothetical protein